MYALKQALVSTEHAGGAKLDLSIFYMDMRTHGKEFDKYLEKAKAEGIRFIPDRIHTIYPGKDNKGVVVEYMDTTTGERVKEAYDLFVLSVGLQTGPAAIKMAQNLGITLDKYNFAKTTSFNPVATSKPGIFAAGAFQGPKDIPQSVTEASSAAMEAAAGLTSVRGTMTEEKTFPTEAEVAGQEPRIGVFICSCGINIAGTIDVKAVAEYAKTLPNVVYVKNNMFTCSQDTQVLMANEIKEQHLNRVVVAACTPRTHEPLFQETMREAGLNKYLFEMANIRNQNSWVHMKEPEKATKKAKDQVRMAVVKARMLVPLDHISVGVNQSALVVGGGVSGMKAALGIADQGYETFLVEKTDTLGGNALLLNKTWKGEPIRPYVEDLIAKVENHPNIKLFKNSTLESNKGSVGNFVTEINVNGETKALTYGIAIVCTGAQEYKPSEYLYGQDDRVLTHLEFDQELRDHMPAVSKAKGAVFIQCVGSRCPERPYCSKTCCTHTMESAIDLKKANPDMPVFVIYRDIRTYGEREDLYREAREKGVIFVRYALENKPVVSKEGDDLVVLVNDPISSKTLDIRPS